MAGASVAMKQAVTAAVENKFIVFLKTLDLIKTKPVTPQNSVIHGGDVREVREFGNRLRARADMQFLVDAADVRIDGGHADVQRLGDLFVEVAAGEQLQHFLLTRRK